ncbi:MalY/PatB family protein [Bacillus sp. FJAT-49736]|uniref:MalY/PatB family protein n=1 Tax=Bacillus sp. FJAT-49736 TaxID=2833582 RepID=UPI001BC8ECBB|nr:MalY/PatB family protein [Bacillus sp. FJAT-49736]MBS4174823.1 pyridoxal phosphate-dependent aminotransferase [Bacillus sp. FJAT-49736]MBS4175520.1 pyridoxal phosphate-dependent aminotransferase [Bacillus sp. FJAT-49736]
MQYNFDQEINRLNTNSVKWDETENIFGEKDLIPLFVADMDFRVPEPVIEAIKKRAEHGVFGYTARDDSYYEAIVGWMKRRHHWEIEKEWIIHVPGVVPALGMIVNTFTKPGDKIIIQPPVYHPFANVVEKNDRVIVPNPLKFEDGRYVMDLEDLENKIDSDVKMIIISSPHNPVGRVWTKEELMQLGEICLKHNVLVVSDEIHFDLLLKGNQHTPFASISEEFANHSIICTAPSKTFNLAGLQTSNIIIPNNNFREQFTNTLESLLIGMTSTFGLVATESAYLYGDEWLEQLLDYLGHNLDFVTDYIQKNIPELKVIQTEGTYLVWIDCRKLGFDRKTLEQFMLKEAKVALNQGYIFGESGDGFVRMNIACRRSILEEGLTRIEKAVKNIRGVNSK